MNTETQRESRILHCYQDMARTSMAMRLAAEAGDWDDVIVGEKHCAEIVAELRSLGDLVPRAPALRARKMELMRQVLANDAAIRDLAQPRMRQLELKLRGPSNARRLARAYGANARLE